MEIVNTRKEDLDEIFAIYHDAIVYQKKAGNNHWHGFERSFILKEIGDGRHYKILAGGRIVASFCIQLSDPLFWKDSDEVAAVYLHRIAIRQDFRGNNVVGRILSWAREFAVSHGLSRIRIDTGAGNDRLINYYIRCGFRFVGDTTVDYTPDLPLHYKDGLFALLEMAV